MPHNPTPRAVRRWIALLAVAGAAVAMPAAAQTASIKGKAGGRVVAPLTLAKTDDLAYGSIVPGTTPGTVSIAATNGAVTKTGDPKLLASTRHRGRFEAYAPLGILMLVTGDPTVTLNRVGGGASMTSTLTYRTGSGLLSLPGLNVRLLTTAPVQEIHVGGTLTVGANQAPGNYQGTYSVNVIYL
ncbi:DUF4402 domain-containing protein [Altererythrobacter sp. CAU 1778]